MTQMTPDELKRRKAELKAGFDPDGEIGYYISIDAKAGKADCSITKTVGGHLVPPVEGSKEYSDRFIVKGLEEGSAKDTMTTALLAAKNRIDGFFNINIVESK